MIVSTTLGALAQAVPGRVPAGYFATGSNVCLGGTHPGYGEYATLLLVGDEDESCLDVNLYLKRTMPYAGLSILAKSGHLLNLEEPERFNQLLEEFFHTVKAGRWQRRDPRSETLSAFGQRS